MDVKRRPTEEASAGDIRTRCTGDAARADARPAGEIHFVLPIVTHARTQITTNNTSTRLRVRVKRRMRLNGC